MVRDERARRVHTVAASTGWRARTPNGGRVRFIVARDAVMRDVGAWKAAVR
jgi:hypothetical protein